MNQAQIERSLKYISECRDPKKLRQIASNAASENPDIERAARLRLYKVLPSEEPGTLEYDVWQSIHALEDVLSVERDKTMRLSRTRQKITRDGELKTVVDLVLGNQSQGFDMLVERNMPELSFEAVALKHAGAFEPHVLDAARRRLEENGLT